MCGIVADALGVGNRKSSDSVNDRFREPNSMGSMSASGPQAVLQFHEKSAGKQTVRARKPSLVAITLGIRDHSGRIGGCSTWSWVAAHLECDFARGISKLRLTGCEGGPKGLRGAACGRHRGLSRSERAAGRGRVG